MRRIFKEWARVHQRYSDKHVDDCTFWYTERPQIGWLEAAVWLCEGTAKEEYGVTKRKRSSMGERPNNMGRCDLSITINAPELCCEAKYVKTNIKRRTKSLAMVISKGMKSATNDVKRLEEKKGFAICFVRPAFHGTELSTMEAKLRELINMVFKDSHYDALVWVGVPKGQEPYRGRKQWFFPGLLFVIKEEK